MADLTTDISATVGLYSLGDFRPGMPKVMGATALVHRLMVRLQTPRGRFSWTTSGGKTAGWPNFGTDMRQFLLSKVPPSAVATAAQLECAKDEQVQQANVDAELSNSGRQINLRIRIVTSNGPFAFSLSITQARLDLIDLQAA
jgi:hypothetical protein